VDSVGINSIGKQATVDVFLSVVEIVEAFIVSQDKSKIIVSNASGRKVIIALSSDPDIRIQEEFEGQLRNILAIEIKGVPMSATHTTGLGRLRNRIGRLRNRIIGLLDGYLSGGRRSNHASAGVADHQLLV
jgi:hypothetical protein